MSRPTYAMRHWLDGVSGVLLVLLTLGAVLSLDLAQRQRQATRLLSVLYEQERLLYELSASGGRVVLGGPVAAREAVVFREHLTRLTRNLQALRAGDDVISADGPLQNLPALRSAEAGRLLEAASGWLESYGATFERLRAGYGPGLREEFERQGGELRTLVRALAAHVESRSLEVVLAASRRQLVLLLGGIGLFLLGIALLRRLLTTPLFRMARGIEAMQRSGRLVKLPVHYRNELGLVALGFNQLAAQVEEQKQRLREHITELQRVNIELDDLANLKDDLLMAVNHQLRTPLTALLEGVELIRDGTIGPLNGEQQAMLETLKENATRLAGLVDQVLDLSLLKSGRRPLKLEPSSLPALLRAAQESWAGDRRASAIRLACDDTLPLVYMDAEAIRQVVNHLLRNAFRHAPQGSEVLLEARIEHGCAEVAVRDAGPGLSPEQLKRLFEPFTHLHTPSAPGSQGSGLGLAFCRQVIERHRGTIRADSVPGRGTTIRFTLPVVSTRFLLEEACRTAQEEAERRQGHYGMLLISVGRGEAALPAETELLRRAEEVLRQNVKRADQFVALDGHRLALVAVSDPAGLEAMAARLREVLDAAGILVSLSLAASAADGQDAASLLAAAVGRLPTLQRSAVVPEGLPEPRA